MGLSSTYACIVDQCRHHARIHGWILAREGAHLGYYTWKNEPWWNEMKKYIDDMNLTMYDILKWNWIDQCDIGIDYFNQYLLKHTSPYPIFKDYLIYRIGRERIQSV